VILFVLLRVFFTLYNYTSITPLTTTTDLVMNHKNNENQNDGKDRIAAVASNEILASPWEGWQPNIDPNPEEESSCSVRKCFQDNHKCPKTCRTEDLGEPPDPPPNWIPDVRALHRMYKAGNDANGNPWPPPLSEEFCEQIGLSGGKHHDNNKALLDAVPISIGSSSNANIDTAPKILCMIYTMQEAHETRVRAIRETWAGACDGFLAFSTKSDPRIPAISIPHDGKEEYSNMWQKVRSIWRFVSKHYADDFDFFLLGGDDLFVLPQNLRAYLATLPGSPDEQHHFVGRRLHGHDDKVDANYFNSGGAGYALSRKTLKGLAEHLDDLVCDPVRHTAMEDVLVAQCLRRTLGVGLTDTRDDQGRERFHPLSPGSHYTWRPPKEGAKKNWYAEYNKEWGIQLGAECCAPDSVSFHYIKKPAQIRHIYNLLYNCARIH
jgi:glycoprotein-N-acetylgalactosamine 3-beta-galactosyltransferase